MYTSRKINDDVYYIGASDRRLELFENVFPVPKGVSYNSFIVIDDKTLLLDTVDISVVNIFLENVKHVLKDRPLDYLVINHIEPDHAAAIDDLITLYPEMKIVGSSKTCKMIEQFFNTDISNRFISVKDGDTISTGKHTFNFFTAAMVHWPEVIVSYDSFDKILYSADAFGTFGALNGNLFADEYKFESEWLFDARLYYTNIVGKYGSMVQQLLKKAEKLEIEKIFPLHGPLWRENINWFIEKYKEWSSYTPEEKAVMIAYGSIYGGTENACNILAGLLADAGIKNIAVYDTSKTHPSVIVAESFRCSHLIFASATYNAGIFINMEIALTDIKAHNIQNRTVAFMQNGTWLPASGNLMTELFNSMKNITIISPQVNIKSTVSADSYEQIKELADNIIKSM